MNEEDPTCSNLATAPRNAATSDQQLRVVVEFALLEIIIKVKVKRKDW